MTYICAHCSSFTEVNEEILDCGTDLICKHCGEHTVVSLETPHEYTWHVNAWARRCGRQSVSESENA